MLKVLPVIALVSLGVVPLRVSGQASPVVTNARPSDDSVTVQASQKYGASGVHRFLLGDNYRDHWARPIKVPVLHLDKYAGGLTPLEEGGNAQTRNLHLRGKDGREYVFRPVFKEVLELPEVFHNTLIEDIFADGLSASHPAATVLPSPILDAAGVLHANPVLYVMPDDPKLGEFRKNFANKLGTMEEFPEDPKEEPGFGGAVDIIDSEDLLEKLNEDGSTQIDAHALLTARLVDMLIGDNDRHPGQWKWAQLKSDPKGKWVPIPRDRDKAFVSYEGALLKAARVGIPRFVTFKTRPQTALFYNAVDFDRRLMASLRRQDFDSTAKFLQRVLTDAVIDSAVSLMPREYQDLEPDLRANLRARRDNLPASAGGYYSSLFSIVDLHGTDAADTATITRQADGSIDIRLRSAGETYFDRRFDAADTKEIRLYLHGGDDVATVTGNVPASIPLWIVGASGRNHLVDSSTVGGKQRPTRMYDNGGTTEVKAAQEESNGSVELKQDSSKGKADDAAAKTPEGKDNPQDSAKTKVGYDADTAWNRRPMVQFRGYEVPPFRDRGQKTGITPSVSFGRGLGIKPMLEFTRRKYGFRQYPYASKTKLEVGYATALQGWEVELATDNRFESKRMFIATETGISQLMTGRFNGFGNDVVQPELDEAVDVNQGQWWIQPAIGWAFSPTTELTLGPVVKFTRTDSTPNTVVADLQPYGFRRFGQAGVMLRVTHESQPREFHGSMTQRIMRAEPLRAVELEAAAAYYPAVWDATAAFGSVSANASSYLTLPLPLRPVLATRLGGQKNFGEFPYFEAAFLGGSESVRTLRRQQYAGDATMYGTAELRVPIAEFPLVLPWNLGVLGFTEAGRVYMDGESPGGWHTGYGGGIWLGVLKPRANLTLTFTNNPDRRTILSTGFAF